MGITYTLQPVHAFGITPITAPVMGIGAVLFRPKGLTVKPSMGEDKLLVEAGTFFTKAFWTSKLTGGANELTTGQLISLERQQIQEFRRRYTASRNNYVAADSRSELLICTNSNDELMGCAGIEIDAIQKPSEAPYADIYNQLRAPLMSNLAVGRDFRRRGVAEELVQNAEDLARKEWGFDECYLYVEKSNKPAIKLYQKLGYKKIWEDKKAKTMIPTSGGKLKSAPTTIVCMRKNFKLGVLGRLLPF